MRRIGSAIAMAAIAVAVVSCSNSVSKEEFKEELDKQDEIASIVDTQCLVDKLDEAGFEFKKYGDIDSEDEAKITEATTECLSFDLPDLPAN